MLVHIFHDSLFPSAFPSLKHFNVFIVAFMENKRDASSAGLTWPLTSNRVTQSTLVPNTTLGDAPSANPSSTPSASLATMSSTSGNDAVAAPWRHTQPLRIQPPLFRRTIIHTLVLLDTLAILNGWSTRSTSRSSHTPATSANSLLKKFHLQEYQTSETLNISSMDCQATGSGLHKLQTIGATILKFLFYMGTTLSATWQLTPHHIPIQ